ncbi:MAG TPA: MoaD/ThiS family protein [Chitinophagaceae bacterium]
MQVKIIIFGQLTDITGTSVSLDNVTDTDNLVKTMNKLYPGLADKKYLVAVDKKIIAENSLLKENSTVALLPPFSGG